ncbi:MAG TPA: uroporphyrinogen-III synthase [Thermohalobaculum sp.]|nr:uroporphyrinogen-III synthase [Thermohalobaculum sp.]
MKVLLTRPLEESRALAARLEADGIETLIWPLTRIVPLVTELKLPFNIDAILFTSANGVRALAALTDRRDWPALCVGDATARAARQAGYLNCFSAGGDARALADLARRSGLRNFLHPRGRDAAGDLKGWLAETGQHVAELILYEARETGAPPAPVASALARGEVDLVTVWSPRNGEILARHLAGLDADLGGTDALAISAAARESLAEAGFRRVALADRPDLQAMVSAIQAHFSALRGESGE